MPMDAESRRARDRAEYAANPEKFRKKSRDYARRNAEERAAYTRAYRAANAGKVAAAKAERRAANPEREAAYAKAYRSRQHPDKLRVAALRTSLKCKYGLTPESRGVMFGMQEGLCAICAGVLAGKRNLHVDHDHKTGRIRGLLCQRCNLILGHAKDNPMTLQAASRYLTNAFNVD